LTFCFPPTRPRFILGVHPPSVPGSFASRIVAQREAALRALLEAQAAELAAVRRGLASAEAALRDETKARISLTITRSLPNQCVEGLWPGFSFSHPCRSLCGAVCVKASLQLLLRLLDVLPSSSSSHLF